MTTPRRDAKTRAHPMGRLDWRELLDWLLADALITPEDSERVIQRFGAGASSLHALVRLGGAGLKRVGSGAVLDTEALTEWLAGRAGLGYLRIDPLRADVGRVADVMSVRYAETRFALPISYGATEVTVATGEPFDIGWLPESHACLGPCRMWVKAAAHVRAARSASSRSNSAS